MRLVRLMALLLGSLIFMPSTQAEVAPAPEPVVIPHSEVRHLSSEVNGIDYKLYVGLPEDYHDSKEKYRVVYMLDADYSFAIARNVAEHLAQRNHLEPLILVAIAYDGPLLYKLNRTRDYTPTFSKTGGYGPEYQKVSGGGPLFLEFITEELIPFIDQTYRTIPGERALSGHSYGGLFSTWVFLTKPELFDHYIVISPSLWYDEEMIFDLEKKAREEHTLDEPVRLYMAVGGDESSIMPRDLRRLAERLKDRPQSMLTVRSEVLEGETHNSVYPSAFSRGLRWTFKGR